MFNHIKNGWKIPQYFKVSNFNIIFFVIYSEKEKKKIYPEISKNYKYICNFKLLQLWEN